MTKSPKPEMLLAFASVCLVGVAVLARTIPNREWIGLAGFSLLGAGLLVDHRGANRRRTVPLGIQFLCMGVKFGGDTVWGRHWAWLDPLILAVFAAAVLAGLYGLVTKTQPEADAA